MDAVTTMNLQWKQLHNSKPSDVCPARDEAVGCYCLTFNMLDFVSILMVLSPLVTRTPLFPCERPRIISNVVSSLTIVRGESMMSRTLLLRSDSSGSPRAARSRIVFSEMLPTHRVPSNTGSCE